MINEEVMWIINQNTTKSLIAHNDKKVYYKDLDRYPVYLKNTTFKPNVIKINL